jgi:hypothetical protein
MPVRLSTTVSKIASMVQYYSLELVVQLVVLVMFTSHILMLQSQDLKIQSNRLLNPRND